MLKLSISQLIDSHSHDKTHYVNYDIEFGLDY